MVAELLVGFRRIVHRGLRRVYGEGWWDAGCPRAVRDRMLARQEAERGVDRFSSEGDETFAYANFADLADVVESVPELADLMRTLAPSVDRLSASLRSLEEVRSKIAGIRPVSEAEHVSLAEMHLRLREKLAGARRRAQSDGDPGAGDEAAARRDEVSGAVEEPTARPGGASEAITQPALPLLPQADSEVTEEIVPPQELKASAAPVGGQEARADAAEPPRASPAPRAPQSVKPAEPRRPPPRAAAASAASSGTARKTVREREAAPAAKRRPEHLTVAASSGGSAQPRSAYDPVGAAALDGAPTPVGLVRVDEDDMAVLRDLRREIISAAEAAYAHAEDVGMDVWTSAWDSGWFSRKLERYGLGEVATFYAVMEQYLERRRKGTAEGAMRTFLADRELAKLLLRLRELFLRLRV